ncbi:hypothetical protein GPALN_014290 [Globodera pallida]|nr:hypothetical protein GPALN_014290 [Globodera pallida]
MKLKGFTALGPVRASKKGLLGLDSSVGQSVEKLDKVSKRENVGGRAREARGASSQNVEGGRGARPGVKAGRAKPALSERSERREGWMEDKRAKPALSERSERREGWGTRAKPALSERSERREGCDTRAKPALSERIKDLRQSVEKLDKVSKRENVGGRAREARGASSQNVEGGRGARPGVKAGRAKPALSERSERREGWMEDKRAKPALSERSERREGKRFALKDAASPRF